MRPTREMRPRPILSLGLGGTIVGTGGGTAEHIADPDDAHDASAVSVLDVLNLFGSNTNVETVLAFLGAMVLRAEPHGNLGATETFDGTAAGWHYGTVDTNCTFTLTANPSGVVTSMVLELEKGTGTTIDLPAAVVNSTELEAAWTAFDDGSTSLLLLMGRDGGTTWFGFWAGGAGAVTVTQITALGFHGGLLLASDHSVPFTFDEILQASDGADFLYASEP